MNTFTIGDALKTGWTITKQHLGLLVGIVLTAAVVSGIFNALGGEENQDNMMALIVSIVGYVVQLTLELGVIAVTLKLLDGQPAKYTDMFSQYPLLGQALIATILASIAIVIGLIIFIIPGIYIALRLSMTLYLLVDEKLSGMDALKKSWEITKGNTLNLLLLGIALCVLNIVGALLLLIGLLVTVPITMVAGAYVYRKIHTQASALQAATPSAPTPAVI